MWTWRGGIVESGRVVGGWAFRGDVIRGERLGTGWAGSTPPHPSHFLFPSPPFERGLGGWAEFPPPVGARSGGLLRRDNQRDVFAESNLLHREARRVQEPVGVEDQTIAATPLPRRIGFGVIQFEQLVRGLPAQVLEVGPFEEVQGLVFDGSGRERLKVVPSAIHGEMNPQEVLERIAAQLEEQAVHGQ